MWFTIQNEIVVAYSNVKSDETLLPENIIEIEKHVKNPLQHLGQNVSTLDVIDFVAELTAEEKLGIKRKQIRKLYDEISFRKDLCEDYVNLQSEYEALKLEYVELKRNVN